MGPTGPGHAGHRLAGGIASFRHRDIAERHDCRRAAFRGSRLAGGARAARPCCARRALGPRPHSSTSPRVMTSPIGVSGSLSAATARTAMSPSVTMPTSRLVLDVRHRHHAGVERRHYLGRIKDVVVGICDAHVAGHSRLSLSWSVLLLVVTSVHRRALRAPLRRTCARVRRTCTLRLSRSMRST